MRMINNSRKCVKVQNIYLHDDFPVFKFACVTMFA